MATARPPSPRASAPPHTARAPTGGTATAGPSGKAPPDKVKKVLVKKVKQKQKAKRQETDILSPAAMLNLYYIAHNVADCLYFRGFNWPGAPKGKKGKGKF
nr:small lysine-rich protein 1 [Meriones unguiculatus]